MVVFWVFIWFLCLGLVGFVVGVLWLGVLFWVRGVFGF